MKYRNRVCFESGRDISWNSAEREEFVFDLPVRIRDGNKLITVNMRRATTAESWPL